MQEKAKSAPRFISAELYRYADNTNGVEKMRQPENHIGTIDEARSEWLKARERAAELANKLFQPGSGYGDPEARASDEHLLQSARHDAENLYREYNDIERRKIELKNLK